MTTFNNAYGSISIQEAGLRAFWSVNGPRIIQVGYEDEEDLKVMGAYEQLGALVCKSFCLPTHTDTSLSPQCFLLHFLLYYIL